MNLDIILTKKGHFVSGRIVRPVELKKAYKGRNIQKVITGVFRAGLDYSSQASVKEKRENGELPSEPQPLPFGEWEKFPYFIRYEKQTGLQRYIRLYPLKTKTGKIRLKTVYTENGKRIETETFRDCVMASEKKEFVFDRQRFDEVCSKINEVENALQSGDANLTGIIQDRLEMELHQLEKQKKLLTCKAIDRKEAKEIATQSGFDPEKVERLTIPGCLTIKTENVTKLV